MLGQPNKISELTNSGIQHLIEDPDTKQGVFQLLSFSLLPQSDNMSIKKIKAVISDGFSFQKVIFGNETATTIKNNGKELDIIHVKDAYKNDNPIKKGIILVLDMDIIYSNIQEKIGDPMEYENFKLNNYINPNGNRQIPLKYLQPKQLQQVQNQQTYQSNSSYQKNPQINQTILYNNSSMNQNDSTINQNDITINNLNPTMKQHIPSINQQNPSINQYNSTTNQLNSTNNQHNFTNNQQPKQSKPIMQIPQNPLNNNQYTPIAGLTTINNNFKLKGRIINKSQVRTFKNQKGEGKLLNIDILDSNGHEIQGTFFGAAVEKFYQYIEENQIYIFEGGQVKASNPNYKPKNELCIVFNEQTLITLVPDNGEISLNKFQFVKIQQALNKHIGETIDIVSFIGNPGSCQQVSLKSGENKFKRDLILYDEGLAPISMTIWGDFAQIQFNQGDIVIVKDGKIGEWQGQRNLTTNYQSKILVSDIDNVPEVIQLKKLVENLDMNSLSQGNSQGNQQAQIMTLEEFEAKANSIDNEKCYADIWCYFTYIKEGQNMYYISCKNEQCKKKVTWEMGYPQQCEFCNQQSEAIPRYIFQAKINDSTSSAYITVAGKEAEQLLNVTATDFKLIKDNGQEQRLQEILKTPLFNEYKCRLMAKQESYNGESKIKYSLQKITVDIHADNQLLIKMLNDYMKI